MQMLQLDRELQIIGDTQTMGEDGRPNSPPLMLRKQVELAESYVPWLYVKGHDAEPLPILPDFEEGFLAIPLLVEITLKHLIPSPTLGYVWTHRSPLGLEGEVDVVLANAELWKSNPGRKGRQFHDYFLAKKQGAKVATLAMTCASV